MRRYWCSSWLCALSTDVFHAARSWRRLAGGASRRYRVASSGGIGALLFTLEGMEGAWEEGHERGD